MDCQSESKCVRGCQSLLGRCGQLETQLAEMHAHQIVNRAASIVPPITSSGRSLFYTSSLRSLEILIPCLKKAQGRRPASLKSSPMKARTKP